MADKQGLWPVNTKLRSENYMLAVEVEVLQKALAFWLPHRPATALPKAIEERLEHDIGLLAGYMGKIEKDADELGWITLHTFPAPSDDQVAEAEHQRLSVTSTPNETEK